jgi:hypothetical protein
LTNRSITHRWASSWWCLGGAFAFFWAPLGLLGGAFAFFLVPPDSKLEPKGREWTPERGSTVYLRTDFFKKSPKRQKL